jgi:hypothetical protein
LTQIERGKTISFFNELDTETRTMLVTSVSFFNEVATETQKLSSKKPLFHFLTRLPQRHKNYPRVVSFFNELEIKNHAQRPLFHFLTRLPQRCKNYPRKSRFNPRPLFSFFNEVAAETQKLILENPGSIPRPLFHFLTRLPQRHKNYPQKSRFNPQTSVSFFNEVAAETQKLSSKPLFLIMDSKSTMLWNDTMSRDKT